MQFDLGKAIMRIVSWVEMYGVKVTVTELLPEHDTVLIFRQARKSPGNRRLKDISFQPYMSISIDENTKIIANRRSEDGGVFIRIIHNKKAIARKKLSIDEYVKMARYFNGDEE